MHVVILRGFETSGRAGCIWRRFADELEKVRDRSYAGFSSSRGMGSSGNLGPELPRDYRGYRARPPRREFAVEIFRSELFSLSIPFGTGLRGAKSEYACSTNERG